MKLGFTGTRVGMTAAQSATFAAVVRKLVPHEFRHGACVGADADAVNLVLPMPQGVRVIAHPGVSAKGGVNTDRDERSIGDSHVVLPEKTHFARNRDIVDLSDVLIGCPSAMEELPTGGTWYTLRYARDTVGKPTICVWPDGTVTVWNSGPVV